MYGRSSTLEWMTMLAVIAIAGYLFLGIGHPAPQVRSMATIGQDLIDLDNQQNAHYNAVQNSLNACTQKTDELQKKVDIFENVGCVTRPYDLGLTIFWVVIALYWGFLIGGWLERRNKPEAVKPAEEAKKK